MRDRFKIRTIAVLSARGSAAGTEHEASNGGQQMREEQVVGRFSLGEAPREMAVSRPAPPPPRPVVFGNTGLAPQDAWAEF